MTTQLEEKYFPDGGKMDACTTTGKVLPRPFQCQAEPTVLHSDDKQRGRFVSGRKWKRVQTRRSSSAQLRKVGDSSKAWGKKQLLKKKRAQMKALEKEIKARKQAKVAAEKERRAERERRKKINEAKSATYQTISNVDKIKKMSKKQLKRIRRTVVNADGTIDFKGIYEK